MSLQPQDVATLQAWQGKTESAHDLITAAPLGGLAATLDRNDPAPQAGDAVPPLAHWLYFLPQHRQSEIGPDGHAKRGGFLPPVPLPRRMWAGGRLTWQANNPLQVGQVVRRHSRIERVQHKQGRSGELVFVLVQHEIHNERGLAITEEHDIVYRAAPEPGEAPPPPQAATTTAPWQRPWLADEVMLFRFSALTFNGHRIHYDRSYVTQTEGYPGLVVHGPLIATLLVDLWRHQHPQATLTHFAFKALRPTFDIHRFAVCGQPTGQGQADLWAHDHEGWLTMQAQAQWT
jgi:3-methylfumaryl-CoA hydratase